jgi:hypothetical protein
MWIPVEERLPELNVLVALIDMGVRQNDPAGDYPVAMIGHLSEFGEKYWSCHGQRGLRINRFTHWAELDEFPCSPT